MTAPPAEWALRRLHLARPDLENLPDVRLPPGWRLRNFQPGDKPIWVSVVSEADPLLRVDRRTFQRAFGAAPGEWARRLLFLETRDGETVGAVAAWFGSDGRGRVHWLAVRPAWQGRGGGRGLLVACLHRLRELGHERAFLITEAGRLRALRLYWRLGFRPELRSPSEQETWEAVRKACRLVEQAG